VHNRFRDPGSDADQTSAAWREKPSRRSGQPRAQQAALDDPPRSFCLHPACLERMSALAHPDVPAQASCVLFPSSFVGGLDGSYELIHLASSIFSPLFALSQTKPTKKRQWLTAALASCLIAVFIISAMPGARFGAASHTKSCGWPIHASRPSRQ